MKARLIKSIKDREFKKNISFISRSAPFVANQIAKQNNSCFFTWKRVLQHVRGKNNNLFYSNLFIVGLYCKGDFKSIYREYNTLTRFFRKTIIVLAGTDILQLKNMNSNERYNLLSMLKKNNTHICAVGEYARDNAHRACPEFKKLKIDVEILYFPVQHKFPDNLIEFPDKFKIGCYVPPSASNFYGFPLIKSVANMVPDVEFHVYSLQGAPKDLYSIENNGFNNIFFHKKKIESADMADFISKMSCGLRAPKHDGNPMSLVEYNVMGRNFIYNKDMPYCEYLKNDSPENLAEIINNIKDKKDLNIDGSLFYRERHRPEIFFSKIKDIYEK